MGRKEDESCHRESKKRMLRFGENRDGERRDFIFVAVLRYVQVAERMLEIADAAGVPVTLYKMNINFSRSCATRGKYRAYLSRAASERRAGALRIYDALGDHLYKLLAEI
ncbi:hypothetical protein ACFSL6_27190 [Paenibacillus thailandensis]|uniref:hypothetical protein n=1 Tax=Paenibacillus thailandensis TaxID=393250 RepID=UPI00362C272F